MKRTKEMRRKKSIKIRVTVCIFALMMLAVSSSVMAANISKTVELPAHGEVEDIIRASSFYTGTVQVQVSKPSSGTVSSKYPIYFRLRAQEDNSSISSLAGMSKLPSSTVLTPNKRVPWKLRGQTAPDSPDSVKITCMIAY